MASKGLIRDIDHTGRLHRKYERLQGLQALLEEWTARGYDETDLYVFRLKHKIKITEIQLKNMRP